MIITPQLLWKDYDRKSTPLAVSTVADGEKNGAAFRYVYFNGEKTADGVVRVFAKLYEPGEKNGAAVAVFDDIDVLVDAFDPAFYLNRGFSVLIVDYAGEADHKKRFTIYPKSFKRGNYFLNPGVTEAYETPPKESCWYIWETNALRSVTFLESLGYKDIFMLGVGHGGEQVWKTCYFENTLRAGAVQFSGGVSKPAAFKDQEQQNKFTAYKASMDATAYANYIKAPVYMQITSNEQNASLDRMNELYEKAEGNGARLSISERANRVIDPDRADNAALWFKSVLDGDPIPAPPKLNPKGSQSKLYYEIHSADTDSVDSVTLFVAHAQKNSAFRNWRAESAQLVSEDEYLSRVSVLSADEPVYAFANLRYKNGFCISSAVERVLPSALSVTAETLSFKRRIYDSDMGLSDWMMLNTNGAALKLAMQAGPFGLEGVTSVTNHLTTFRLADPQYKGKQDSVLQITLYSPSAQSVFFSITSSVNLNKYICKKELLPTDNWSKLTLSPGDFRGAGGSLSAWDVALTLEIESNAPVLINSLLWV